MKKFLVVLFALFCFVPSVLLAEEKAKVKVYLFEAGECPYCEAEVQYLEGLSSYGKKFEIVRKELYVDHETWAKGADYKLGVKLAKAFNKAGYENADYTATPFVIISDVYAATGYSEELEEYINAAYEIGDNDIVECAINEATCFIGEKEVNFATASGGLGLVFAILAGFVVLVALFLMFSSKKTNEFDEEEPEKESISKTERKGYEFEKGRIRAQEEKKATKSHVKRVTKKVATKKPAKRTTKK